MREPINNSDALSHLMQQGFCAAMKGDARWVLLSALCELPPDRQVGKNDLKKMTGLSISTIKRARRALKEVGLIYFDATEGGNNKTSYRVADLQRPEVVAEILARIASSTVSEDRGHVGPGPRMAPLHPVDGPAQPNQEAKVLSRKISEISSPKTKSMENDSISGDFRAMNSVNAHSLVSPFTSDSKTNKRKSETPENALCQSGAIGHQPDPFSPDAIQELLAELPPSDEEAAWYESHIDWCEEVEPGEPAQSHPYRLLAIDPGTRIVGYAVFAPGPAGPTLIASDAVPVRGVNAKARVNQAGAIVASLIETIQPTAILLENPDYTWNGATTKNVQTFIAGVKQIESAIVRSGLPFHRLNASRHSDPEIKMKNRKMFEERVGRPASEDEADAARLGWDYLLIQQERLD